MPAEVYIHIGSRRRIGNSVSTAFGCLPDFLHVLISFSSFQKADESKGQVNENSRNFPFDLVPFSSNTVTNTNYATAPDQNSRHRPNTLAVRPAKYQCTWSHKTIVVTAL